ncbi:MAG TPA: CHASE2 domain-containing protein [Gemmatimonadaceae bacterium]|nr:CHASE2 domain-containing protein [Gemmatimonadaceae bacterium]
MSQLFTAMLEHQGAFDRLHTAALDSYLVLASPRLITEVVTIGITDADYATVFEGRSPLDPSKLRQLIEAIAAGRPKLIVVDIDTSGSQFDSLGALPCRPPIVWAQDAIGESELAPVPHSSNRVFGEPCSKGIAVFPRDSDGVVRRYARWVPTREGRMPTLPWAAVQALNRPDDRARETEELLMLNFGGDRFSFPSFSAEQLVVGSRGEAWSSDGPLVGKIVVLGGTFRAARDVYVTPFGERPGMNLVAQAIAAELDHGGIRTANHVTQFALETVIALAIVWINYLVTPTIGVLVAVCAVPVGALVVSWISFSALGFWVSSVPVLAGVTLDQVVHHLRQYQSLRSKALATEGNSSASALSEYRGDATHQTPNGPKPKRARRRRGK